MPRTRTMPCGTAPALGASVSATVPSGAAVEPAAAGPTASSREPQPAPTVSMASATESVVNRATEAMLAQPIKPDAASMAASR
jgi:hypothetical protein